MAAEPSGRTLAFLGDVTWSYYVRRYLVETRLTRGSDLQRHAVRYESAKAQAEFYRILHEEGFFTEEEEEAYRRGRNDHTGTVPKNTPVQVYRCSTGFEALIGSLELRQNRERIETIWDKGRTLKEGD